MRAVKQFALVLSLALSLLSQNECHASDQAVASESDVEEEGEVSSSPDETKLEKNITVAEDYSLASGPLVDLFGAQLLKLNMANETHASIQAHFTAEALQDKKVIGVYFSADWCPSCVKFTPELVQFFKKVNKRRRDDFAVVWVSRCRDVQSFSQYFAHMTDFYALPPEEAMGARGTKMSKQYGVKGIPSLILLDEDGSVITRDARAKIPQDRAGVGFPWRNPLSTIYITLVPRKLRSKIKERIGMAKEKVQSKARQIFQFKKNGKSKVSVQ